jgi:hypothetical protein
MYFPRNAIECMVKNQVVKNCIYMILYTQEEGSVLDRTEEPFIWNDHDFDRVKGLQKREILFFKMYKQFKIYQLYSFDSDEDAKLFFKAFLMNVNCSNDTIFFFAKRKVDVFTSYKQYMQDRDDCIEGKIKTNPYTPDPEGGVEDDPDPYDDDGDVGDRDDVITDITTATSDTEE